MSDPIYEAQAYEIAKMARSISALEAENAKLREQVTRLRDDWESERDYADQMEAKEKRAVSENAKLRELLAGAFEDMVAWQRVIACSNEWGYGRGCREQLFELRDAMRDLGVEVDFDGC